MLIVVDAQKGFSTDMGHVSNISKLVEESDDVLFTVFSDETPDRYVTELGWNGLNEESSELIQGISSLDSENPVIERDTYDLTKSDDFMDLVDDKDRVYLAGFETDACVLATAYGLFDEDIATVVVKDACYTSAGREAHNCAIKMLERNIGSKNVKDTREVIYRM